MPPKLLRACMDLPLGEIVLGVAILVLLAAVAIPGYQRARLHSQAYIVLHDALAIDAAIDHYALDHQLKTGETVNDSRAFASYLESDTRLQRLASAGLPLNDLLGNGYRYGVVDGGVKISGATERTFADVIEDPAVFWGACR